MLMVIIRNLKLGFFLGLVFLSKSLYAQDYRNVIISDIASPFERSIIVSLIEDVNQPYGRLVLDFEGKSKIGYKWWGSDTKKLLAALNQNKQIYFYLARPISDKNIWLSIDNKRSTFLKRQIALDPVIFRGEVFLDESEGYTELENNNSPFSANIWMIQDKLWLLGELSSRADKDFFFINLPTLIKTLNIRLFNLHETTFDPILVLYDEGLNKILEFNLNGKQQQEFNIAFIKRTNKFYLEVKDKVGPLDLEPGKILNYNYALKLLL